MWPQTSRSVRLAVAALIWSMVGSGLLAGGAWFAWTAGWKTAAAAIISGLALGFLKGRFLLEPIVLHNAGRIGSGPGSAWLGAAFSLSSWAIAAFFMAVGMVVRKSGLAMPLIGFIYVAAGSGLLYGSFAGWRAWRRFRCPVTDS